MFPGLGESDTDEPLQSSRMLGVRVLGFAVHVGFVKYSVDSPLLLASKRLSSQNDLSDMLPSRFEGVSYCCWLVMSWSYTRGKDE